FLPFSSLSSIICFLLLHSLSFIFFLHLPYPFLSSSIMLAMVITRASSAIPLSELKLGRPKKMKEKLTSSTTTLSELKSKRPKKIKKNFSAGDKESKRSQKRKAINDGKGSR
ncbi:hypothetical protein TorRG33x02_264920, partial [Trema orientale]